MTELISDTVRTAVEQISDWYIPEKDPLDGFLYPGSRQIRELSHLYDVATRIQKQCLEKTANGGYDEFVVRLPEMNRSYRGHRIETIEGYFFALRRMPTSVPDLASLGLDPAIRKILLSESLNRGGLVLICGETGQGKSTSCAAAIKERMVQLGSFCLTVEDPPEMPLHGTHGLGRCLQTEVRSGSFADSLRGAMRCYPTVNGSILYVGETRDAETAAEVLKIAMNGNLVFTTLHAQDVPSALRRIVSLAATRMGQQEAQDILSTVFRVGMHQTLESVRPRPGEAARKRLNVSFLLSANGQTPVANRIRKGETNGLGTDLQQQKALLIQHGPDALMRLWN